MAITWKSADKKPSKLVVFGYPCPIVNTCCFSLPLRLGTYIIAMLGMLPTIVCTTFATPLGARFLQENGLPVFYSPAVEVIYGILGLVVFSAHVILLVSVVIRLRKLINTYLISSIAYMIGSFVMAIIIAVETIKSGHIDFGVSYILLAMLYTLLLFYFWVVVHSQLYMEKGESNVVNIHITIL